MAQHKVITIAQQKGGAGKTTVAAHLAVAFAQKGNKVAIIDIDPQGSLTHWHAVREKRFGEGFTGLHFSTLSGWRLRSEIDRLKEGFDIIVIDSPPHTETEAKTAIRVADVVVIPVQPSPTDLWATKSTVDICKSENVPCHVLLNRVSPNSKLAQQVSRELSSRLKTLLGNRVLFASSLLEGRCVTETAPTSQAAQEVRELAGEIAGLVGLASFAPAKAEETKKAAPKKKAPASSNAAARKKIRKAG